MTKKQKQVTDRWTNGQTDRQTDRQTDVSRESTFHDTQNAVLLFSAIILLSFPCPSGNFVDNSAINSREDDKSQTN